MGALLVLLVAIFAGLLWWMKARADRLRRDAESREAHVMEALFTARRSTEGGRGETIDVDKIFGHDGAAAAEPISADAVLRAAKLEAEVIALVKAAPAQSTGGASNSAADLDAAATATRRRAGASAAENDHDDPMLVGAAAAPAAEPVWEGPIPVRDLVQTFYEARGYRVVPAAQSARPIQLVLRHKTDPLRSYAFAALDTPVSAAAVRSMLGRARVIDQSRVLIAAEHDVDHSLMQSLLAQGVRVLDRGAIDTQLEAVDFATAAKIRAVAQKRALRRQQAPYG